MMISIIKTWIFIDLHQTRSYLALLGIRRSWQRCAECKLNGLFSAGVAESASRVWPRRYRSLRFPPRWSAVSAFRNDSVLNASTAYCDSPAQCFHCDSSVFRNDSMLNGAQCFHCILWLSLSTLMISNQTVTIPH